MSAPPELSRPEWWREYASWQLGHREGPLCVRCGATITREQVIPSALCEQCEQVEHG